MTQEYWKWPENVWALENFDCKQADSITAGVDIGPSSAQSAILCDNKLIAWANTHTGPDYKKTSEDVLEKALTAAGMQRGDVDVIFATGFGKKNVSYAARQLDEVQCIAKGARYMYGPAVTTVVDLGGRCTKAIKLYDWDRVEDFMMNDKCATGMGMNIEAMADLLGVPITEMGERSLQVDKDPEPVSTTCYNFANPETIGLFRPEYRGDTLSGEEVLASYHFAIAWRILGTVGKLMPLDVGELTVARELAFTGGLAKNPGVTKRLERELKVKALTSDYDPQLAGALGAALHARRPLREFS